MHASKNLDGTPVGIIGRGSSSLRRVDVLGSQPDNSAASIPDLDGGIVRYNFCGLGYGKRIIVAVRLSPQRNMVIRCEQIEAIERHGSPLY
jgi:hypothetical protein